MKCSATCATGRKCRKNAIIDEVCWVHSIKEMSECGICLEESYIHSQYNITLDCKHVFCESCIFTWIVEKVNNADCPTCRTKINKYIVNRAMRWGENKDLLYRPELTIYKTDNLDEVDKYFMNIFCDKFKLKLITEDVFNTVLEHLKKEDLNYIFEKLKRISYKVYPYVKKSEHTSNKLHIII